MIKIFFWKIIFKIFNKEINDQCIEFCKKENSIFTIKQKQEKRNSTIYNYPIGSKVIIRSNQPENLLIGSVVRYEDLGYNKPILLVVLDEKSGEEFMPLDNSPMHWSKECEDALMKLNWIEQWNVMNKGNYVLDNNYKLQREVEYIEDKIKKND